MTLPKDRFAELDKHLGMDCDISTWVNFKHFLSTESEKRFKEENK